MDDAVDDSLAADLASTALATARRFHAGATMWCVAPRWEPHAQHVAVEFVHPVIVGKRALPAVALTGPDLVATARISIRPADHVLWLDDPDPLVPATGRFVLLYHLLWELTHVCFEHPGLLTEEACTDDVCITCSDEGRLGEVVGPGRVRTASGVEDVETLLIGQVQPGDLLLVHAGTAIGRVEP